MLCMCVWLHNRIPISSFYMCTFLCMYVFMYAMYVCFRRCTEFHFPVSMRARSYVCMMHIHMHSCIHPYHRAAMFPMYINIGMHEYIRTMEEPCFCSYSPTSLPSRLRACNRKFWIRLSGSTPKYFLICSSLYVCMYVCMYVWALFAHYSSVCMYVCMWGLIGPLFITVCVYVCVYVCKFVGLGLPMCECLYIYVCVCVGHACVHV